MKPKSKSILFLALAIGMAGFFNTRAENISKSQNLTDISESEKIIGGYLPYYRMNKVNSEIFDYLTHVYYFAVGPSANGELGKTDPFQGFLTVDKISYVSRDIDTLRAWRGTKPVKIFLVVGGWELSDFFDEAAADPTSRANLVSNIKNFCLEHQIDGVDLDWEAYNGPVDETNYGLLVSELREAFNGTELQISATVNPKYYNLANKLTGVDFLQIMSYGSYFDGNTQVSISQLEEWTNGWNDNGWDKSKLVIGLPAFAKTPDDNSALIYNELIGFFTLDEQTDLVQHDGKMYYFNNIETVNQKTQFMMNQDLGGVMIWEIGQDVSPSQTKSLVRNIHETLHTTLSSEEISLDKSPFKLYPNPASEKICLEFDINEPSEIKAFITNISGQVVWRNDEYRLAGKHKIFINISEFSNGYYLLNWFNGNDKMQGSFIKTK